MKIILFILFLLSINKISISQTDYNSNQKNNKCTCNLRTIYQDSIENDTLLLSKYSFKGISNSKAWLWRKRLNFCGGTFYKITDKDLKNILKKVCRRKMKKDLFIEAKKDDLVENAVIFSIGFINSQE